MVPDSAAKPDDSGATPAPPPRLPVDTELIPGRVVEPIDLANALRLTGARRPGYRRRPAANLRGHGRPDGGARPLAAIALLRADLVSVRRPDPDSYRPGADDRPQRIVRRRNGGAGKYDPGAAAGDRHSFRERHDRDRADFRRDLHTHGGAARPHRESGRAPDRDQRRAARKLPRPISTFRVRPGGWPSPARPPRTPRPSSAITKLLRQARAGPRGRPSPRTDRGETPAPGAQLASGQLLVASANLIRLLVLDPKVVMVPVEPPECIIHLIPDDVPLDDLVIQGLQNRPELASAQALVEAAVVRRKQARLRPFIPSVFMTYAGGGLGGGANAFFGNFGPRGDAEVGLYWELQNLGFTDVAIMRRRAAELEISNLEKTRALTQVGADIVAAFETRLAAARQIEDARETLVEAIESLRLNFINIRQGAQLPRATRPIEVLQPIQALAQGRLDYLDSVLSYNRAQFQLKRAIGQAPLIRPNH